MDIVELTKLWVKEKYTADKHLLRTEYWLKKLKPDADEAMVVAAITHDIERAFLKNRKAPLDAAVRWDNKKYSLWHGKRSAKFAGEFLKEVGMNSKFISRVRFLITWHELGGDRERDLIKDVDSVSFFENNISFFLKKTKELEKFTKRKVTRIDLKRKFDYMFNRISSDKAKKLAEPYYDDAIKKLNNS